MEVLLMGFFDKIKNSINPNDESGYGVQDDYTDQITSDFTAQGYQQPAQQYTQPYQPQYQGDQYAPQDDGMQVSGSALELKVVKPERFDNAPQIANHLLNRRTVVLNLESTNKETARRLLDFLSGVVFSLNGNIKRVANNTYVIAPCNVDVSDGPIMDKQRKNVDDYYENEV